jgi:hypothetical protein
MRWIVSFKGIVLIINAFFSEKRKELPIICQFNVKIEYSPKRQQAKLDQIDQILNELFEDAHFVLLDIDESLPNSKKLFMVNVKDEQCHKFLC